ncbi:ATP-dependent nuclease [Pseudomonas fluorescens group sp. PF-1]
MEIQNFRSIRNLVWAPGSGLNCLIGPGDSGKSTILDAIDLCLGFRRNAHITDVDFFSMDVTQPINITVTLRDLDTPLKSIETYGMFLRSCNPKKHLRSKRSLTRTGQRYSGLSNPPSA